MNNRGEVVGWAETVVHDPTCHAPQVLQFRAVLWEPKQGTTRQLPPLPGDSASSATAINQRGQVVGISGEGDVAVGRKSATHAVLWDGSSIIDLGSLGGDYWRTPMAINNAGVVRFAGDQFSEALGVNDAGQIVGVSCADVCNAVLWQGGTMYHLQDLISGGTPDLLWSARDINASGQITGRLIDHVTRRFVTYVATPITP